jgi:hypothetical protein
MFAVSRSALTLGRFVGVLHIAHDQTLRICVERRLRTLRAINEQTALVADTSSFHHACLEAFATNPYDLPFVISYGVTLSARASDDQKTPIALELCGALGVPDGHPSAPQTISLRRRGSNASPPARPRDASMPDFPSLRPSVVFETDEPAEACPWPVAQALSTGEMIYMADVTALVDGFDVRGWSSSWCAALASNMATLTRAASTSAVVLPIVHDNAVSVVIIGLNQHRPYDDAYKVFMQLLSRQLLTGLAIVRSHEQALAREAELLELDRSKSALYTNASHELKTPLTLIVGPLAAHIAEVEAMPDLSRDCLDNLHLIMRNAERLRKLINTLLDLSRIEAGHVNIAYETFDFGALVSDLANLFAEAIYKAELGYSVDVPADGPAVTLDPALIETVRPRGPLLTQ